MPMSRTCRTLLGSVTAQGARLLAVLLLVSASSSVALASPTAPEIDPASMAGALTLLSGGILMLTDRVRRRP